MNKKKSFFSRITGSMDFDDETQQENEEMTLPTGVSKKLFVTEEEEAEGELTVDVYETKDAIVIEAFAAGVKPEDLELTIARDFVTIRGKREASRTVNDDNYVLRELYWGAFSRTITLPHEVEPEEAEAIERHGLLMIKLQKIDKEKKAKIKVKSL
jgi:HSP20 family protein